MKNVREYYLNLFSNKDDILLDVNLDSLFKDYPVNQVTLVQCKNVEGLLTIDELIEMKNNKTLGIDGFSAEFFQGILNKIEKYCTSLNYSFNSFAAEFYVHIGVYIYIICAGYIYSR